MCVCGYVIIPLNIECYVIVTTKTNCALLILSKKLKDIPTAKQNSN